MANTESAKKRNRQTITKTSINKSRLSRMKTFIKKAEELIKAGNKELAQKSFIEAQSEIARIYGTN